MVSLLPSNFKSHYFNATVGDQNYIFRILKMNKSVFIYIGSDGNEVLDEIGVAMPMQNNEIVGTTALGPLIGCESKEFSMKLAKKLNKQVYISCNVPVDRMVRPLIEKCLSDEIKAHPEHF